MPETPNADLVRATEMEAWRQILPPNRCMMTKRATKCGAPATLGCLSCEVGRAALTAHNEGGGADG